MLPDRVSNPGPLTYESGALPIALRGPAKNLVHIYRDIEIDVRRSNDTHRVPMMFFTFQTKFQYCVMSKVYLRYSSIAQMTVHSCLFHLLILFE